MPTTTIAPAASRPSAPAERGGPPPGSSPGDFAALLDQTTARTARAEGHDRNGADAQGDDARRPDATALKPTARGAEDVAGEAPATTSAAGAQSHQPKVGDTRRRDLPDALRAARDKDAEEPVDAAGTAAAAVIAAAAPAAPLAATPVAPAAATPENAGSQLTGGPEDEAKRPATSPAGVVLRAIVPAASAAHAAVRGSAPAQPAVADGDAPAAASVAPSSALALAGAPAAAAPTDARGAGAAAVHATQDVPAKAVDQPVADAQAPAPAAPPAVVLQPSGGPAATGDDQLHDDGRRERRGSAQGAGDGRGATAPVTATPGAERRATPAGRPARAVPRPTAPADAAEGAGSVSSPVTPAPAQAAAPDAAPSTGASAPSTPATPAPSTAADAPAPPPVAPAAHGSAAPAWGPPALARTSLHATVERVQELARISALRGGNARAVLQLKPVELGTIDVQLRTSRDGLVATINAHDQAGLQALQQSGGDLRRALEDRGVVVHRLDVQLSPGAGGHGPGQHEAAHGGGWAGSGRSGAGAAPTDADFADAASGDEELLLATAPRTPAGALVDVQA